MFQIIQLLAFNYCKNNGEKAYFVDKLSCKVKKYGQTCRQKEKELRGKIFLARTKDRLFHGRAG